MNSTELLFNPEIPEENNLEVRDNIDSPTQPFSYMKDASEMSLEEEFLKLAQWKTIEELKDCQDNIVCIMLGTIKHVIGGNVWWYAADEPTILPTVIGELVEQTMLFKIVVNKDVNSGFEQSFGVKKLCPEQDIVNSGGVEDDLAGGVVYNDIDAIVVQDLGSKF
ncbi:hypothetical protein RYX36_007800 [Vicia faba]